MPAGDLALTLSRTDLDAVVFDLDGVLTDTAAVHLAAWKQAFDAFLADRDPTLKEEHRPFTPADYEAHVDGRPRYDGVRGFLASRGITVSEEEVLALGGVKNREYQARIQADGVPVDPTARELLGELRAAGFALAVVTSSRNGRTLLEMADLADAVDVILDGNDLAGRGLPGKPAPDMFLAAADALGCPPGRVVVFEDAESGVEAGRRGGFGLVVGVDRTGHADALLQHGATEVVPGLAAIHIGAPQVPPSALPSALDHLDAVVGGDRPPAVFLDYDGTLTPIVRRPEMAVLSDAMRAAVQRLAAVCPVAIISGRDRADVEAMVQVPDLVYAGSHGFDIRGPAGAVQGRMGEEHRPALEEARTTIDDAIDRIDGAWIEPKRHSFAVHYRETPEDQEAAVRAAVEGTVADRAGLRITEGKKVFEVQPRIDWDKGKAVHWLLDALGLADHLPVYLGDDITDEDAFRALRDDGVGILVRDGDRPTLAHYAVDDTDGVQRLLSAWAQRLETRGAGD